MFIPNGSFKSSKLAHMCYGSIFMVNVFYNFLNLPATIRWGDSVVVTMELLFTELLEDDTDPAAPDVATTTC